MTKSTKRTDFLLPKAGFWEGLSNVFNVFGTPPKFKTSESGFEADYKAIKSDWEMVGEDFRTTIKILSK